MRYFTHGYPTAATFANQGFTTNKCPSGCAHVHSNTHRLWHCPSMVQKMQQIRPVCRNPGAKLAYKHLDQLAKLNGLQRAWTEIDAKHDHTPVATEDGQELDANKVVFQAGTSTYIDGSCVHPTDRRLARAAYAISQQRPDGTKVQLVGEVPAHAPQTAAHAEHLGALMFRLRAAPGATGVVDCGSVITAARNRGFMALGHHVHSDLWHEADEGAWFRKTKAHRTLQEARQQGDLDDYLGNDEVDQKCRAKATELLPQAWELKAYLAESEATRLHNRYAAQILACYVEHQTKLYQQAKQARREQASSKPVRLSQPPVPHTWQWDKGPRQWVCTTCGSRATHKRGQASRKSCPGHWGKLQDWCTMAERQGHCAHISAKASGQPGQIVSCTRCGLYAEHFPRKLMEPCLGLRHTYKANRIRQGKHPKKAEWLYDHRRWHPALTPSAAPPADAESAQNRQAPEAAVEDVEVAKGKLSRRHSAQRTADPDAAIEGFELAEGQDRDDASASQQPGTEGAGSSTDHHRRTSTTHAGDMGYEDYYVHVHDELDWADDAEPDPFGHGASLD